MKYLIDILQAINGIAIFYAMVYIVIYLFRGIGLFNAQRSRHLVVVCLKQLTYYFYLSCFIILFFPSKETLTQWLIKY